jgi:rifampicin phosphotransferase
MAGIYRLAPDNETQAAIIGSKAFGLIRLMKAGLPVPSGIVLGVDFFAPWMTMLMAHPVWSATMTAKPEMLVNICADVKAACAALHFSAAQASALESTLGSFPQNQRFAVRSSSPEEDLSSASFAGAYETVLGVKHGSLEAAVRRCFASALDERIIVYKRQMGLPIDDVRIAVIIQRQLESDVAGVAFSVNPLNNDHDEAVLDANWGQGEAVVSGQVSPDSFVVDKTNLQILSRTLGSKESSIWLDATDGIVERQEHRQSSFCLEDGQVAAVTDLLLQVEALYGMPVDVEWAIERDEIHLLQARPITTFHPIPKILETAVGEPRQLYWDLTISVHGIFEPLSPLGTSILGSLVAAGRKEMYGGGLAPIDAARSLPVITDGRIYLNLNNFIGLAGRDRVLNHLYLMDPLASNAMGALDLSAFAKPKISRFHLVLSVLPRMRLRLSNIRRAMTEPDRARSRWENQWLRYRQDLDTLGHQETSPHKFAVGVLALTLPFIHLCCSSPVALR